MTAQTLTRPASLDEWLERSQKIVNPVVAESLQHGLAYQAQPTDVFISPFAKCGTTWLQQIVHSLRTRGDMDFEDMLEVIPWLEMAQWLGHDLYAPQRGGFRVFKCHLSWEAVPKGGRYIVSFRDPKDAFLSDYNFINGYSFETGAVSIAEYAKTFIGSRSSDGGWHGDYWSHLMSWWKQRDKPEVLLLCYEHMKADLTVAIKAIADFLGIELDHGLKELTVKHTSRDFMLVHKAKFSGRILQEAMAKINYTPLSNSMSMVTDGRSKTKLPDDISLEMDDMWHKTVEAETGFPTYQALCDDLI